MKLTQKQLDSIEANEKYKLLVAGPGTGKSETILNYVKYLIKTNEVDPATIFLLTFTRAATNDLRKKIADSIPYGPQPTVSTLHGFSLRQVIKNSNEVDFLPSDFVVADDFDERHIIMEDIKRMLGDLKIKDVKELFNRLSANWENLTADRQDWVQSFANPRFIGAWQQHRKVYGYALRAELVYQLKKVLEQLEEPKLDGPINYLIVDEYQDLNRCDLKVVEMLTKKGASLFSAGDDDQSIYGFRFAFPEGIRSFTNDYIESKEFIFTECFRCGKEVLDISLRVIEQDYTRIPKQLISKTENSGSVHLLRFPNQDMESSKIAKLIYQLNREYRIPYSEIIILFRTDHNEVFSSKIVEHLVDSGIPLITKASQFSILDTILGRYFTSLVKILQNRKNDLAIRTILDSSNGIGPKTIDKIYSIAESEDRRFGSVCEDIANGSYGDVDQINRARKILKMLFEFDWETVQNMESFNEQVESILQLIPSVTSEFEDELNTFLESMSIESVDDFYYLVNDIVGSTEQDLGDTDAVRLMSMHQAKGLSADAVFIIAAEDEYIPGKGNPDEERRLLYVSMTRARRFLFISHCNQRIGQQAYTGAGRGNVRKLTRFLSDIGLSSEAGTSFEIKG